MINKRKFIFDTDMGPDCDDCGALAIIDTYHREKKIELLGVTHCTSDLLGINVIAAIHDHFGVKTPIGQTNRTDFLAEPYLTKYTAPPIRNVSQKSPRPHIRTGAVSSAPSAGGEP